MSRGGGGGGSVFMTLAPFGQRTLTQDEITAELSRRVQNIPGVQVFAQQRATASASAAAAGPVRFAIIGNDYEFAAQGGRQAAARRWTQDPVFDARARQLQHHPGADVDQDRPPARRAISAFRSTTISTAVQTLLERPQPRQLQRRQRHDPDRACACRRGMIQDTDGARQHPAAHRTGDGQDGAAVDAGDLRGGRRRPEPAAPGPAPRNPDRAPASARASTCARR